MTSASKSTTVKTAARRIRKSTRKSPKPITSRQRTPAAAKPIAAKADGPELRAAQQVPGHQRQAPAMAIGDFNDFQSAFRCRTAQIGFEQRRAMCGKVRIRKRRKTALRDKRQQTEQTQLVRCGHNDECTRFGNRDEVTHERVASRGPGSLAGN